jgi:hypothetical protein
MSMTPESTLADVASKSFSNLVSLSWGSGSGGGVYVGLDNSLRVICDPPIELADLE